MTTSVRYFLSTPPALRSEIARYAYSCAATRSLLPRASVNGAVYQGARIGHWRGLHRSSRSSQRVSSEQLYPPQTTPPPFEKPSGITPPQETPTTPAPRPLRRLLLTTALTLALFTAGFGMAAAPAAETINGFVKPPSDAETLTLFQPATASAEEVNEHIITHPVAVKLRASADWTESRPHLKIPPAMRPHNLTGGTLLGEGKIEVPPLTFQTKDAELPSLVQMSYVGHALCGHPGIIHGGLLATMLDEGLARACFPALPNKVGVTASLKIDYRVPCPAESYIVLRAETTKVEGRKAWVKGWIELLGNDDGEGTKLVEAEALFIEPKGAKNMARVYSTQ